jgi:hypothetical protein
MNGLAGQNWAIYEANVQQYRVISATVQSFLLTIGSILFTSSSNVPALLLTTIFVIGLAHILWIWIPIVYARHKIVDYYKFQHDCKLSEDERTALEKTCGESEYVVSVEKRKQVNKDFFKKADLKVWRLTRVKLDLIVPTAYAICWIELAAWKYPW